MRIRRMLVAGAVVAAAAAGCAEPDAGFDVESPDPLAAMPACEEPPPPSGDPPAPGAALPPGAIITGVREQAPLTNVLGYVEMTPIAIRQHYEQRGGVDVEILVVEDEVFEVEILISTGEHRMFLKGRAVCDQGTQFHAVVAPEVDAEGLPVPAGTPDPELGGS